MNTKKILSIILMICGGGILILGAMMASGESTAYNLRHTIIGGAMLVLGVVTFINPPKNTVK